MWSGTAVCADRKRGTRLREADRGWKEARGTAPNPWSPVGTHDPYHVVAGQQLLQELRLFVHHRLNDELVVAGDVEEGAAGAGVGQLDQRLVAQRVLEGGGEWVGRPICDELIGDSNDRFAGRLSPSLLS